MYLPPNVSSRMLSTANDRSPTVTASRAVLRTNQDPCRPWISSTWPSIYSLSIIRNVNQKTSSKANGKLILLRYATHRGKRSSTCVAMVCSSIHVARPTSSFVTGAAAALATFSCAFTRKAYELTTHFRVQPNGKGQGLIGDIPLQLSGVGNNVLLQFTILEIYH